MSFQDLIFQTKEKVRDKMRGEQMRQREERG
jgi:hypothetical protein